MARTRAHALLGIGVVALSSATASSFTRVLRGTSWMAALIVAAMLAVLIAIVAAARSWSTAKRVGAQLVAMYWWSAIVTRPSETWLGLPTPRGGAHWIEATADSLGVLRHTVVPAAPKGSALQLVILTLWIAAAITAHYVLKLEGILHCFAAPLALFIVAAALGKGGYGWSASVWAAAAMLVLAIHVFVGASAGRTAFHTQRDLRSRLIAGGALGAIGAILIGALAGPRLPTAQDRPLLRYRNFGAGNSRGGLITAISPLIQIRDQLNSQDDREVFTVQADHGARWRLVALDSYRDGAWTIPKRDTAKSLQPDPLLLRGHRETFHQDFTLGPFGGEFLPAAYEATGGVSNVNKLVYIPESASLIVPEGDHSQLRYSLDSSLPDATPAELRAAPPTDPNDPLVHANAVLESPVSKRVRDLAETITNKATTQYDKALALQQYLRSPIFRYDTTVDLSESSDALVSFLFDQRRGFCEQFAGSFSVMARHLGIPTRIAVGFQAAPATNGVFHVSTKQAHAWPEVYFPSYGWIAFEPTPTIFDDASLGDPNGTGALAHDTPGPAKVTTTTRRGTTPSTLARTKPTSTFTGPKATSAAGATSASGSSSSLTKTSATIAIVASGISLPFLTLATLKWRKRRRRQHAPDPRDRVLGAWTHTAELFANIGVRRRPSTTPMEFALREAPARGIGSAGPALLDLARIHSTAMYSDEQLDDDDAHEAWACVQAIERSVRASRSSRRQRFMLRFRL